MSYHSHYTLSPLAQNHWTRWIQAPLIYLQSCHNYPTSAYLHNLISIQRPRSTRSSSVVTLARPPSSSSLKITDRSFRYASPCLWNQLPLPLRQRSTSFWYQFFHFRLTYAFTRHFFLFWFTTLYIYNSRLKTYFFHKSYPRNFTSFPRTAFMDYCLDRFFWATRFLFSFFLIFLFLGRALD